jgi:integrase/recombinase XerD
MGRPKPSKTRELRGHTTKAQSLTSVIQETLRLWRKHHLGYDQTKYAVEEVRRRLGLEPPRARKRTVQRLIQATYRNKSKYGLMIETLFQTGARVEDCCLSGKERRKTTDVGSFRLISLGQGVNRVSWKRKGISITISTSTVSPLRTAGRNSQISVRNGAMPPAFPSLPMIAVN